MKIYRRNPNRIIILVRKKNIEISTFFPESFFILVEGSYICNVNQLNNLKILIMKKEMTAEQKAKKAAANKAYREKKKAQAATQDWMNLDKFEKAFDHKVRLFKNLKLEKTNSYCASPGSNLTFEKISNNDNLIVYRVRRTGRRTFFTTSNELKAPVEA